MLFKHLQLTPCDWGLVSTYSPVLGRCPPPQSPASAPPPLPLPLWHSGRVQSATHPYLASALAAIKRPYILCCVFPPAGFMGWRIDFTMCLQQHGTHGVTVGAHNCAVSCFQKRVQFFFFVLFFDPALTPKTQILAPKCYFLIIYIIFYDIDFRACQVFVQTQSP